LRIENIAKYMPSISNVKGEKGSGLAEFVRNYQDNEFSWEIIQYVKKQSGL
jgi:hypothetical protein